jgi:thioredoxin:protein disulfide reductase
VKFLPTLRTLLVLLSSVTSLLAHGDDNLLEPDQAFRFSARLVAPDVVEVSYRVAEGYYLYKDRFEFTAEPATLHLGEPRFPPASWHEDDFFGRVEIYRGTLTVRIPLAAGEGATGVRLSAVSQGCADVGVCYLPITQVAYMVRTGGGRPTPSAP